MSGICDTCVTACCAWRGDLVFDCSHYTPKSESNYTRLFGTPERAARTLVRMCMCAEHCEACPLFDQGLPHCEREVPDIGSIEFWLRGDAE